MATQLVIPSVRALKDFIDRPVGPSEWVTVTQKKIDLFAEATGDHQWIHVDPERARRDAPFGSTIAHGYLTLSLAPMLLAQLLRVEGVAMTVNYGIERMRLPAAVPAGSRIRMRGSIKSVREAPGGSTRVILGFTLELEGSAKPACTADAVLVYVPAREEGPRQEDPQPSRSAR